MRANKKKAGCGAPPIAITRSERVNNQGLPTGHHMFLNISHDCSCTCVFLLCVAFCPLRIWPLCPATHRCWPPLALGAAINAVLWISRDRRTINKRFAWLPNNDRHIYLYNALEFLFAVYGLSESINIGQSCIYYFDPCPGSMV